MPLHPERTSLVGTIVHPIKISTPFAVGDVFAYLITDEKIVLVDCGHKEESAYERVKSALTERGLTINDIDEIWLTHGHPDHFGQAARLADESGAAVYGHPKERADFACNDDRELFAYFFDHHDIPGQLQDEMLHQLDWLQQYQEHLEPDWVEDGERLSSGRLNFMVKHTPGHAPGHVMFREDSGLIIGGDVLLEHISTNALINFDPDTEERNKSLLQYRESLRWVRNQDGYVLPGHGTFIDRIRKVADHHMNEHEKRYEAVKKLLQSKSRSLFELAGNLFPDAMQQGAAFLVLSEVLGYLDWGIEEGEIERMKKANGVRFKSR